jgi:hypothetical protein
MTETGRPRRHARSSRVRKGLWIGGTILACAVIILVFGALSTPRTTPEPAPRSNTAPGLKDYTDGMAALAAGDTTRAVGLLNAAAAAGNTSAAERLADITDATPSSTPSTAPDAVPTDDTLSKPVADVSSLLPASMTGYTAAEIETSADGAILAFAPTYTGPYGRVSLVVMSVFDKGSEAKARAYVEQMDRAYPKSGATVTVGTQRGHFGTDGSHLAAVAFSRGRYAFEVVATAARPDPSTIRDVTITAAAAFPAAQ